MKKHILCSFLSLLSLQFCTAQNPLSFSANKMLNKEGGTAAIATEEKEMALFKFAEQENTFDFGTIPEGPKVTHVFNFVNAGKVPLVITNAQASCGCTSPVFSKEPVLPGQKGKISVTYSSEGHPGNFVKSVYLTSNAGTAAGSSQFELFIKGIVVPTKKN